QKGSQAINNSVDRGIDKGVSRLLDSKRGENSNLEKVNGTDGIQSELKIKSNLELYKHFSFIPGEQIIYVEDFEQHPLGALPLGWNANSSGNLVRLGANNEKWLNLIN